MARMMYQSLYQMHLMALHGFFTVFLQMIARALTRRVEPRVKLH
jgi:NADH dehydrogenase